MGKQGKIHRNLKIIPFPDPAGEQSTAGKICVDKFWIRRDQENKRRKIDGHID